MDICPKCGVQIDPKWKCCTLCNFKVEEVKGLIGFYGLSDWWLSTFTEAEKEYIDNKFQPMVMTIGSDESNCHMLTQDDITLSDRDTSGFLTGLMTWFRLKKDASIFERIHNKVVELGNIQPIIGPGYYKGRHYTTYAFDIKQLKREGKLQEAEKLLLELINATEIENSTEQLGVAPWYYEELAKVYRKRKEYNKEISTLERFSRQNHAPGVTPPKLLERLNKSKLLLAKETAKL